MCDKKLKASLFLEKKNSIYAKPQELMYVPQYQIQQPLNQQINQPIAKHVVIPYWIHIQGAMVNQCLRLKIKKYTLKLCLVEENGEEKEKKGRKRK